MTPAEVIAMRDELSAVIEESKLTDPVEISDMLIGSGWVTNEPGRKAAVAVLKGETDGDS